MLIFYFDDFVTKKDHILNCCVHESPFSNIASCRLHDLLILLALSHRLYAVFEGSWARWCMKISILSFQAPQSHTFRRERMCMSLRVLPIVKGPLKPCRKSRSGSAGFRPGGHSAEPEFKEGVMGRIFQIQIIFCPLPDIWFIYFQTFMILRDPRSPVVGGRKDGILPRRTQSGAR